MCGNIPPQLVAILGAGRNVVQHNVTQYNNLCHVILLQEYCSTIQQNIVHNSTVHILDIMYGVFLGKTMGGELGLGGGGTELVTPVITD